MKQSRISTSLVVTATLGLVAIGSISTALAESPAPQTAYYPQIQPSQYYILPGQMLRIVGNGFIPGENVILSLNGQMLATVVANGGNLDSSMPFVVPYADSNSTATVSAMGVSSMTSLNQNVAIGTFYPQMNPSSYYVAGGDRITVNLSGFAPMEPITITVAGISSNGTADSSGNLNVDITTPVNTGTLDITASGSLSRTSVQRTITTYTR